MRIPIVFIATVAALGTLPVAGTAVLAQGAQQTVTLAKIDVVKVSTGFRASKMIGASIVNEANDTIGKIDDIVISDDGKAPYAVLSVGGFLGMGTKLVAVAYEDLKTKADKIVLHAATKESLKALPEFKYASN